MVALPFADRYTIDKRVSGDAAVDVYEAHEADGTRVRLRVLRPAWAADPEKLAILYAEVLVDELVDHPVLARVLDAGVIASGEAFVARENAEGIDLRAFLADGARLDEADSLAIVTPVVDALAAAHAVGVHYRQLRPERVIVARASPTTFDVKLVGLGARDLAPASVILDPDPSAAYVAPERVLDPNAGDARADVWALGVLLFELLSGRAPFVGATTREVHIAVTTGEVPSLTSAASVSSGLAKIVDRCLKTRVGDRYPTAGDLASALHALRTGETVTRATAKLDDAAAAARHAHTIKMASAPPRAHVVEVAPASRVAPLQLRTRFAYEASAFAELFGSVVGRVVLRPGYVPELTSPEGPSTGGGAQSRQHVRLVPRSGGEAIVVGFADLRTKQAELRTLTVLEARHRARHRAVLGLDPREYAVFLAKAIGFFEAASVGTRLLDADPAASNLRARVLLGYAAGVAVVLVILVVAIVMIRP